MEKQLFVHYEPKERVLMLKNNCDKIDNMTYSKQLDDDELRKEEQDFSELAIKISTIEDEFAQVKSEYTSKLKPLKSIYKSTLNTIQTRQKLVTEEVYCIVDYENLEVGVYNHRGDLIKDRKLTEEEKQLKIEFMSVDTLFPELKDIVNNPPMKQSEVPQETITDEVKEDTIQQEIVPTDDDLKDENINYPTTDPEEEDY